MQSSISDMLDYGKSSCFKGKSNEYLEKKNLFTQDIFFYIVVIFFFFTSFQKAAFIMAIVVHVNNVAHGPLGFIIRISLRTTV